MIIQEVESIVCYDVDETLIKYAPTSAYETELWIKDPYNDLESAVWPHLRHIKLLKSHKGRGMYVKVWSAAGYKWAEAVVKALGLEDFVDAIETKPHTLIDDLPVEKIFPQRVYLEDK